MAEMPSRRSVLYSGAVGLTGALGGCILDNQEVSSGHLYVENMSTSSYRVNVTVTEGEDRDGNRVVSNWYRIPIEAAIEFEEVIAPGTTYTITVHRPDVPPADRVTLTVPPCGDNGDIARDVIVQVKGDGMGIISMGCDEQYTLKEDLDYDEPSTYTIDPPEEARRTPTTE